MLSRSVLANLTPLFATVTLPVAILAFLFVGWQAAVAALVIGWLLLTPASAILFRHQSDSGLNGLDEEIEQHVHEQVREKLDDRPTADPIEELRARYARGEIDDLELEQGMEALLETEDLDPDDQEGIERAVEHLVARDPALADRERDESVQQAREDLETDIERE